MMDTIQNWTADAGLTSLIIFAAGSTVILLITFFANWLLRKRSAACRFSVWQTAFLGLLFIPVGLFVLPEIPLGLGGQIAATNNIAFVGSEIETFANRESGLQGVEPADPHEKTGSALNADSLRVSPGIERVTEKRSADSFSLIGNANRVPWQAVLFGIWLLGAAWMMGGFFAHSCWFHE